MSFQIISCKVLLPFSVKGIFREPGNRELTFQMRIEERLIEQVKQHDVLYDTKSFNYRDYYVRQQAWEEIGRDLKITGEAARKAWNTLRSSFVNAIYRRRKKSGEAARKSVPWKHEHQMSFLLPFICTSKSQNYNQDDGDISDRETVQRNELKYNIVDNETCTHLELPNATQQEESEIVRGNVTEMCDNPMSPALDTMKLSNILRKPIYDEWQSREMDETDMFFFSMAKMTKRLPLLEQANIKLQLSNAVLQAQIKLSESMEQERPSSACSASSSTLANFVEYDTHTPIQTQQFVNCVDSFIF